MHLFTKIYSLVCTFLKLCSCIGICYFDPEILPEAVPGEFFGLWTYLVEHNKAELEVYEKYLQGPPEPPPIWVPDPRPVVNWARLNTNIHRNLPHPMKFHLLGCSQDPAAPPHTLVVFIFVCCVYVVAMFILIRQLYHTAFLLLSLH